MPQVHPVRHAPADPVPVPAALAAHAREDLAVHVPADPVPHALVARATPPVRVPLAAPPVAYLAALGAVHPHAVVAVLAVRSARRRLVVVATLKSSSQPR